jgi:class 3 adenylate cyclase
VTTVTAFGANHSLFQSFRLLPGCLPKERINAMNSDLVGSTALSARMDPEDLHDQKCVADTVQRSGGYVAKYMGDGVRPVLYDQINLTGLPTERLG